MGRNLSPGLQREFANLEKDASSHRSAMRALKSYVKDLDSKEIPLFLAQISKTKETGSLSGEYTISLCEVLARVHGVNIVPQIDSIMATIIKTLASSAGSFMLQQACSKVVTAIARYSIDPKTPEDKKRYIIHCLCKPLSEALLSSHESLTSGAALCLNALVDMDNWRFASDEMVNRVCQNVVVALDKKFTQTNSQMGLVMGLVMALVKHNALIVEAYVRLLIQSGLRILNTDVVEGNFQNRLSAIQMINFLMKCLDPRSIFSEVDLIVEEMEKFQSDQTASVSRAAFEALRAAKKIFTEKESKFETSPASVTGSNFGRRDHRGRRNQSLTGNHSPASLSPESQALNSFIEHESLAESPISSSYISHNMEYERGSANRKLLSYENGGVGVSLRDGSLLELVHGSPVGRAFSNHYAFSNHSGHHGFAGNGGGFLPRTPRNGLRSSTPSPPGSHSHINVDNNNTFTTPRKPIHSLQDPNDNDSDFSEKQSRWFMSPCSSKFDGSPNMKFNRNGFQHNVGYEVEENRIPYAGHEQFHDISESGSSTEDVPADTNQQLSSEVVTANKENAPKFHDGKGHRRRSYKLIIGLFFVLATFTPLFWIDLQEEGRYLVPT